MTKGKKTSVINKIVPDTSVIIEGTLSKKLESKEIKTKNIIIHEAVLSELENQANLNREIGFLGLEEIKKLRELSSKLKFNITYSGKRPKEFEIEYAKAGEIDELIRALAHKENGVLLTADKVQALVAESKAIKVILIELKLKPEKVTLEKYFDESTMSVHLRENALVYAKRGVPGKWMFDAITKKTLVRDDIKEMANEIVEKARVSELGFIEIERTGSTIIQLGLYRIVITKPPLSDGWEITAVKPIRQLKLEDYKLSEKLGKRIGEQAEGILIAGRPGAGKSCFCAALAEFYFQQNKIVKTVEAPRDLLLPAALTQYAISHSTSQEIHDILLLSRPDRTIFDEMRDTADFKLFADLRLAGIGFVGVIHATNPIDAIQRFIGRIEMGVIPQVIDTVIYIKDGSIAKVLSLGMSVKVPSGMTEADLARPIVTVTDFETTKPEYEIYRYGEQTVVIPVQAEEKKGVFKLAEDSIKRELLKYVDDVEVELLTQDRCRIFIPKRSVPKIIGREGKNIEKIEKRLGISIDVQELAKRKRIEGKDQKQVIEFEPRFARRNIVLKINPKYANKDIDVYVEGEYVLTIKSGKKGIIRVKKSSEPGKIISSAIRNKEKIELKV